ncbi:cGMP-dependent protein kinase, isozyme 1 [Anopheles aquasalis]|uniref:cGMP-dependent protein kinase, isozyme 1 n=1 Tax=Anopheles aquasalis TaxID=42839 RepID=UPI00215A34AC|nr:cGMP-dependent protein kinase, isozyme 1 [Anopheles aquasalis]
METIKRENIQLGDNRALVGHPMAPTTGHGPLGSAAPTPAAADDDGNGGTAGNPTEGPLLATPGQRFVATSTSDKSVQSPCSPTSHRQPTSAAAASWFRKSNTCGSLYVQCACDVAGIGVESPGTGPVDLAAYAGHEQHQKRSPGRPISLSDKDIRRIRPSVPFVHPDSLTTVYGGGDKSSGVAATAAAASLVKTLTARTPFIPTAQTATGEYAVLHAATVRHTDPAANKRYSTPTIGVATPNAFHPEFVLQKLETSVTPTSGSARSLVVCKQRHSNSHSYPGVGQHSPPSQQKPLRSTLLNGISSNSSIDEVCGRVREDSISEDSSYAGEALVADTLLHDLAVPLERTGALNDDDDDDDGVLIELESTEGRTGKVAKSSACAIPVRKGKELWIDDGGVPCAHSCSATSGVDEGSGSSSSIASKLSVSLDSGRTAIQQQQRTSGGIVAAAAATATSPPDPDHPPTLLLSPVIPSKFDCASAKEYLIQSGILGPMGNGSSLLLRKTSKIVPNIDTPIKERIRKNSVKLWGKVLTDDRRKSLSGQCDSLQSYGSAMTISGAADQNALEEELNGLRRLLRARDEEIDKLRREIDKLKSVLQQKAVSNLEQPGGMTVSGTPVHKTVSSVQSPTGGKGHVGERELLSSIQANYAMAGQPLSELFGTSGNSFKLHQMKSVKGITLQAMKKQGVSGESCDLMGSQSSDIKVPKYKKDFSAKQLIKDAIMENDFFKNIDSLQIREIVDSMYSREFRKGEYVIHEGEAGSHLYISAAGEFEVIKDGKVLGSMGPGRAFGELAILYNCTRTASIRVLCDSRVWVLDRRVFQQIMMRTGMQRIEENVNFLKSVPLLKHLSNDVLTKIADVLEVEFYPAGAYIIRQGAAGDTFFLISQGTVKVTQRLPGRTVDEEIRILVRGEYFGEQALIKEDKRTANIIAMSPGVECLTLDRESFTKHIGDLCELQEKNYGDEERVLAFRNLENTHPSLGSCQPELMDVNLTDLEVVGTLGVGGFGRVELVKLERNGETKVYALKCMKKRHIVDTRQQEHMYSERKIMLACQSPFICRLYRTYKDSKYAYMLLEACMGGEVWTILRDHVTFEDSTAKFIVGCVLQAFDFLHARGIVYRDLKPENLLLDARGYAKLVDFGFSKFIGYSSKTWTFCGTPEYVAPEIILNKGHDRSVDYWALGILIHELLTGIPPFTAADPMKTYNIILKGIDMVNFPKHMSRAAISLIKRLCRDVPSERLGYQRGGVQDIKKHKWFQGFDWDGLIAQTLKSPLQPNLTGPLDLSNFDIFPKDLDIPPDELSGWDADF